MHQLNETIKFDKQEIMRQDFEAVSNCPMPRLIISVIVYRVCANYGSG